MEGKLMSGIKETEDLIKLVKVTGQLIQAAKADGSIDWKDIGKLGPEIAAIKDAVIGGPQIPEELKDLDEAEINQLFTDLVDAVTTLVQAVILA
jgi:hypothetical protein